MIMLAPIPCQCCGESIPADFKSSGYVCDKCGYRICPRCISKHRGKYSNGGFKCSQCAFGIIRKKD